MARDSGLDASVLFCSASRRCSRKRSAGVLSVSPMQENLHRGNREETTS